MIHFLQEHSQGPGVDAVVAVKGPVDCQFFSCFCMSGYGYDLVVVVFEVVPDFSGFWIFTHLVSFGNIEI